MQRHRPPQERSRPGKPFFSTPKSISPVELRQTCFHGALRNTRSRSRLAACSSAHPHLRLVACTHGSSFSAWAFEGQRESTAAKQNRDWFSSKMGVKAGSGNWGIRSHDCAFLLARKTGRGSRLAVQTRSSWSMPAQRRFAQPPPALQIGAR